MKIELTDKPSHHKGWGGYKVDVLGDSMIYAGREVQADNITIQVWNSNTSKSGNKKQGQATFRLRAAEGETTVLEHREGAQRTVVTVRGAVLAEDANASDK